MYALSRIPASPGSSEAKSSSSLLESCSLAFPTTANFGSMFATFATMCSFTAALRRRCFAHLMHQYASWIVVESTAYMPRILNFASAPLCLGLANAGSSRANIPCTSQKNFCITAGLRVRFAWEKVVSFTASMPRMRLSSPANIVERSTSSLRENTRAGWPSISRYACAE